MSTGVINISLTNFNPNSRNLAIETDAAHDGRTITTRHFNPNSRNLAIETKAARFGLHVEKVISILILGI